MSQNRVKIMAAGGLDETTIGTSAERIHQAIIDTDSPDGILVLIDLGSALLSTQIAIEMLPVEQQSRIMLSDAPMVEGTIAAAVEASLGHTLVEVKAAAEAAKDMRKIL